MKIQPTNRPVEQHFRVITPRLFCLKFELFLLHPDFGLGIPNSPELEAGDAALLAASVCDKLFSISIIFTKQILFFRRLKIEFGFSFVPIQ